RRPLRRPGDGLQRPCLLGRVPRTSDPGLLRRSGPPRTILDRAAGSDGIAAPPQGRLSRLRGRPGRLTATGRAKAGPCCGGARLGRVGDENGLRNDGAALWRAPRLLRPFFPRRPEAPAGRPSPRRARAPGPAQAPRPGPGPAGQMSGLPCCRASLRSRKNPRVIAIRTPRTVTGHIRTYPVSNQVMMFSFPEMTKWELSWRAATAGSARDGGGGFLGLLIEVPGDLPDP